MATLIGSEKDLPKGRDSERNRTMAKPKPKARKTAEDPDLAFDQRSDDENDFEYVRMTYDWSRVKSRLGPARLRRLWRVTGTH